MLLPSASLANLPSGLEFQTGPGQQVVSTGLCLLSGPWAHSLDSRPPPGLLLSAAFSVSSSQRHKVAESAPSPGSGLSAEGTLKDAQVSDAAWGVLSSASAA